MEEKKVPWWRKALSFALGGIRSGFGLFSKTEKVSYVNEPEIVSAQEDTPEEESQLIEHLPTIERHAEAVNEVKIDAAAETDLAPEAEAQAKIEVASQAALVTPTSNRIEAEENAEVVPEPAVFALGAEPEAPVEEGPALVEVVAERERDAELEPDAEASPVAEFDHVVEALPEVEQEPEAEPEAEPVPKVEAERESEISDEPQAPPEPAEPVIAAVELEEATDGPMQEIEAPAEIVAGSEVPPELRGEEGTIPELVVEPVELGEQVGKPEVMPEMEYEHEPVIIEEPASAVDSIPVPGASSVELSEAVPEDAIHEPTAQPEANGDEAFAEDAGEERFVGEATPAPEDVPQIGHAAEQAAEAVVEPEIELVGERVADVLNEPIAEEDFEPVIEPMELNEPIPEQDGEPLETAETVPVVEAGKDEAVPNEEAHELGDDTVLSAEQTELRQPELEHAELEQPEVEQKASEQGASVAAESLPVEAAAIDEAEAGPKLAPSLPPHKPFIKLESRDNEADLSPFSVIVSQVYDGPLDLLLDLIRKQDIDVYDIPIARITAQFLAYVNQLKATDVDVAGEFIYTASLLIHIKSKMLLPRAPSGQDDAAEDPRRELVERLLEHERFKNAAQMLQQKQMLEAASWTNPGLREFQDDTSAEPEIAADTVDLVRIFRDILERARSRPVINLEEDSVTVGQMIQFLARRLTMEDKPVALRRLLSHTRSERALIAMFLALLELVRLQAILLRQDLAFSEIFIKKHTGFESVMNEGAASARDDWR